VLILPNDIEFDIQPVRHLEADNILVRSLLFDHEQHEELRVHLQIELVRFDPVEA
jgi:hypothetical protein